MVDLAFETETPLVVHFHAVLWSMKDPGADVRVQKMVMDKVVIDYYTDLPMMYAVPTLPTVLAINNGDVKDKLVGLKD